MPASTRKPEFAWKTKLTWSMWQCERIVQRDEPDAEEAGAAERATRQRVLKRSLP